MMMMMMLLLPIPTFGNDEVSEVSPLGHSLGLAAGPGSAAPTFSFAARSLKTTQLPRRHHHHHTLVYYFLERNFSLARTT